MASLGWETMLVHTGVAMSRIRVEGLSKGAVRNFLTSKLRGGGI